MELNEFQSSCQSSKHSHADVMINSSKYQNVECYFKKFTKFTSCAVLEKLSECLCIISLGDCRCSCVYTAACFTGLQESMEVPEPDTEREGPHLRGTTCKCWMVGNKGSSQQKQHWMGQLLGAASKESEAAETTEKESFSVGKVWVQPKLPGAVQFSPRFGESVSWMPKGSNPTGLSQGWLSVLSCVGRGRTVVWEHGAPQVLGSL